MAHVENTIDLTTPSNFSVESHAITVRSRIRLLLLNPNESCYHFDRLGEETLEHVREAQWDHELDFNMNFFKEICYKTMSCVLEHVDTMDDLDEHTAPQLELLAKETVKLRRALRCLQSEIDPEVQSYCRSEFLKFLKNGYLIGYSSDSIESLLDSKTLNNQTMTQRLIRFGVLQRFFALCHGYEPHRAILLKTADIAMKCSLDRIDKIRSIGVAMAAPLMCQAAEWLLRAGEDLATASFCRAQVHGHDDLCESASSSTVYYSSDIAQIFMDVDGSPMIDNYTYWTNGRFHFDRWDAWKEALETYNQLCETETRTKRFKDAEMARIDAASYASKDALIYMDSLDYQRKQINRLITTCLDSATNEEMAQKAISEIFTMSGAISPIMQQLARAKGGREILWRSKIRFVWAAILYSLKDGGEPPRVYQKSTVDRLMENLIRRIKTILRGARNRDLTMLMFLNITDVFYANYVQATFMLEEPDPVVIAGLKTLKEGLQHLASG
ncbi:hypothetical protein F5Y19DRAFT_488931 [Xylariaceae sp. FL1651]|nr:hypothetical protein F5Y19DRAFT_488931 [Xylariaceae sp. FL1651]